MKTACQAQIIKAISKNIPDYLIKELPQKGNWWRSSKQARLRPRRLRLQWYSPGKCRKRECSSVHRWEWPQWGGHIRCGSTDCWVLSVVHGVVVVAPVGDEGLPKLREFRHMKLLWLYANQKWYNVNPINIPFPPLLNIIWNKWRSSSSTSAPPGPIRSPRSVSLSSPLTLWPASSR